MSLLAIDGGASAAKWRLQDDNGQRLAEGRTLPLHGHLFSDEDRQTTTEIISGLGAEVLGHGRVSQVVAGITGLGSSSEAATWFQQQFCRVFGLDAGDVLVADDLWLVCLGTLEPGKGMLIYAGTGSVGYHLAPDLRPVRAGGYGFMIDDAGSGYWIGAQALKQWLRETETGKPATGPLAQALEARFGSSKFNDVRGVVYGGGRRMVASLSKEVHEAAIAGDPSAVRILAEAGEELAGLAGRLFQATGCSSLNVFMFGGIRACGPWVLDPMRLALAPGLDLVDAEIEGTVAICRAVEIHGFERLAELV